MHNIYGISKELILAKGIFPYSFFDSFDKMKYDSLPPIEDFYDTLSDREFEDFEILKPILIEHVGHGKSFSAIQCKITC